MYRFACRTLMLAACILATGVAGLGVGAQSAAQTAPVPDYYWCPGQPFDPAWGPNWDPYTCHDDFHRDRTAPTTAATTPDPSSKVPCLTIPVLRRRPRLPVAAHSAR
ncbi:Secreted protein antigen [Mycobacterium tuberculosis]|nr:Secreted protein antigen [Mycobacterium tuberculosis]